MAIKRGSVEVPLWLFPIILYSVVGLTYVFKAVAPVVPAGPPLGWFLEPQHCGAVGYTLFGVLAAGAIWLWAKRRGFADQIVPFARPDAKTWLWAVAALIVSYLCLPPSVIRFIIFLGLHGRTYDITDPPTFVLIAVYAVLIGPLCEEILFRGFGIGVLIARGINRWLAGIIAMIFFVAMHLPAFGPGGLLLVLPFSVLVTVLRIASGNLTSGLLLHVMNNIIAFLVLPLYWAISARP